MDNDNEAISKIDIKDQNVNLDLPFNNTALNYSETNLILSNEIEEKFGPEQIEDYKEAFLLFDTKNVGTIDASLLSEIFTTINHDFDPDVLNIEIQKVVNSKSENIDLVGFLTIAARTYLTMLSSNKILNAFETLQPDTSLMNTSDLCYFMTQFGEPLRYEEYRILKTIAGEIVDEKFNYKILVDKLSSVVDQYVEEEEFSEKMEEEEAAGLREEEREEQGKEEDEEIEMGYVRSKSLEYLLKLLQLVWYHKKISDDGQSDNAAEDIEENSVEVGTEFELVPLLEGSENAELGGAELYGEGYSDEAGKYDENISDGLTVNDYSAKGEEEDSSLYMPADDNPATTLIPNPLLVSKK